MEPYIVMVRIPLEPGDAAEIALLGELPQKVEILGVMRERDFAAVMGLTELPTPSKEEMEKQAELLRRETVKAPTSETLRKEQP